MKALTQKDIKITIETLPEDIHPYDRYSEIMSKEECNKLFQKSKRNPWHWCVVKITGYYKGLESEPEYLGSCSYKSQKDFIENSGYYEDMVNTILTDLNNQVQEIVKDFCNQQ
jgi:hypothetical protein